MRFGDTPGCESMSEQDKNKVMHVALPIGQGMLMASDYVEGMGPAYNHGNDFSIALNPDTLEDTHRIFDSLAEGGKVDMPLEKTFWAELFGMVTDKFGIQWLVNYGQGNSQAS